MNARPPYYGIYNLMTGRCNELPAPPRIPAFLPIPQPPIAAPQPASQLAQVPMSLSRPREAALPHMPPHTFEGALQNINLRRSLDPMRILEAQGVQLHEKLVALGGSDEELEERLRDVEVECEEQALFREAVGQMNREAVIAELAPPRGWDAQSDSEPTAKLPRQAPQAAAREERVVTRSGRVVKSTRVPGATQAGQGASSARATFKKEKENQTPKPSVTPSAAEPKTVGPLRKRGRSNEHSATGSSGRGGSAAGKGSQSHEPEVVDRDETISDDGVDHETPKRMKLTATASRGTAPLIKRKKRASWAPVEAGGLEILAEAASQMDQALEARDQTQSTVEEKRLVSMTPTQEKSYIVGLTGTRTRAEYASNKARLRKSVEY